jgi:hypothetical protein
MFNEGCLGAIKAYTLCDVPSSTWQTLFEKSYKINFGFLVLTPVCAKIAPPDSSQSEIQVFVTKHVTGMTKATLPRHGEM